MAAASGRDLTVLELNTRVRELFRTVYPYPIWLRGTLAGRIQANSRGHTYFQLVDNTDSASRPQASIDCVLFAGARTVVQRDFARAGMVFDPSEGIDVRILGRVDIWPQSGRFQFVVEAFDPGSFGASSETRLRELLAKLAREGLVERNRSLPFPALPLRIGLVSAPGSAALEDFLTTLRESGYPFEVLLHPAQMQGAETMRTVVEAMSRLALEPSLDVLVITRGGGSATDLSWFDSEPIGRAIAAFPAPVVSGIGHEVDFTLPDFIAHTRAKTPTHAASILVDRLADAAQSIDDAARDMAASSLPRLRSEGHRIRAAASMLASGVSVFSRSVSGALDRNEAWLRAASGRSTSRAGRELERMAARLGPPGCLVRFPERGLSLDDCSRRLRAACGALIDVSRRRLDALSALVAAREPARMLEMGWAIVTDGEGRLLTSASCVEAGDRVGIRLRDGRISARAVEVDMDGAS